MSGPAIDPLKVIERAAMPANSTMTRALRIDLGEASAAIRELIEATKEEYDAEAAYAVAKTGAPRNSTWERLAVARQRRRGAAARIVGAW